MNSSLGEQLVSIGLVSEETYQETEGKKRQDHHNEQRKRYAQKSAKSQQPKGFEVLTKVTSAGAFKHNSLDVLKKDPGAINEIIEEAHRLKDAKGGKKLIWLLYQIRDKLSDVPKEKRGRFLDRALRRANPCLELPN